MRLLNPAYSAALRNVIKDHSQKTQAVTDEGSLPPAVTDGAGMLSPRVLPPPAMDEAASDPSSPTELAARGSQDSAQGMEVTGAGNAADGSH